MIILSFMILLIVGSALWVLIDARADRNVRRARAGAAGRNTAEMDERHSPVTWALGTLVFWPYFFPSYLAERVTDPGPRGRRSAGIAVLCAIACIVVAVLVDDMNHAKQRWIDNPSNVVAKLPPAPTGAANIDAEQCGSEAQSDVTAIQAYDSQYPSDPIGVETTSGPRSITLGDPSTYDQGAQAQKLILSNYVSSLGNGSSSYSLSISTTSPGRIVVHTPAENPHGVVWSPQSNSGGCAAAR